MRLLLNWILSALAVWIVSRIVPDISVSGPVQALIAALVIGFINATIGALLKILTFPLTHANLRSQQIVQGENRERQAIRFIG